jgi:hypothetical protein
VNIPPQILRRSTTALVSALALTAVSTAIANPGDKPSLTCTADRSRSVRVKGGDWDDKTEKIQFDLTFRNDSMSKPTGGLSATFFVIGEDAGERNKFKLLQKESIDFSLEGRGTHETRTPEIKLKWDNTGAIFGEKYRGWILQVRDNAGDIVSEASSSSFLRSTDYLADMEVGDYLDKSGEPEDRD